MANDLRVLLVEDNADMAELLAMWLRRLKHKVATANSVAEALGLAAAQPFDLVISDLRLADGSGLDLMRQLKTRHSLRGICISGYGNEIAKAATAAGFAAFLSKPVTVEALDTAIRGVMAVPPPQGAAPNP